MVQIESSIMICILESNSNLKDLIMFPLFELAKSLCLNFLLVHHF